MAYLIFGTFTKTVKARFGLRQPSVSSKYDGETATRFTTENGLPGNDVKAILEARDGTLWFGTYQGLAKLQDNKFITVTDNEGAVLKQIRTIYEDDTGTLWLGT